MRKKQYCSKVMIALVGSAILAGCGASSVPGSAVQETESGSDDKNVESGASAEEKTEVDDADTTASDGSGDASSNGSDGTSSDGSAAGTEVEENVWDGGPDFASLADELYGLTSDLTIEEALERYAINLVDGGKYADYEGDIGDVIPEYKDKDLDGDHKPDPIIREGKHYVIEFSKGGSLKTADFSSSPNEGEIIEFQDTACRNADEILFAHYTCGTGGPNVWDTYIYSNADGDWKAYPIIDDECVINSKELRDHIAEKTGSPYAPWCVRVAGIEMTTLLVDYGHKEGADQYYDYETAYLHKYFAPGHVNEREDFSFSPSSGLRTFLNNWPMDFCGDEVTLTSDLQYKMNVFLSNFSEQNYTTTWYDPVAWAHFSLEWKRINAPSELKTEDGRNYIDQSSVNQVIGKYFGSNLEEGEFFNVGNDNPYGGTITTDDDYVAWYSEPAADGEMYRNNAFSVVTDLEEIAGDRERFYSAKFRIYSLDTEEYDAHGIGKQQYSLSAADAEKLEAAGKLHLKSEGLAIFDDAGEDGYWLSYYKVAD